MVAPRMLGPEVRRCYEEGVGFITAVGVHRDATGTARARTLAVAKAIGGLKQGAIEMTAAPGGGPRPRRRAGAVAGAAPGVSETFVGGDARATASRSRRSSPSCSSRARSSAPTACCGSRATPPRWSTTRRPASTASCRASAGTTTSTSPPPCGRSSTTSRPAHFADEWDAERDAGFPKFTRAQGRRRRRGHRRVRSRPPPPARRDRGVLNVIQILVTTGGA